MATASHIEQLLRVAPVLPIVTIDSPAIAADLGRCLVRGGMLAIEVTLRTVSAYAAIEAIAREVPEIIVGAGTVLTRAEMRRAAGAGASFAVSPGTTGELLAAGREGILPYLPGVLTASEIQNGILAGYTCFKFFPAAGEVAALKAFAGPFPTVRFCATGGITADTAQNFLALSNVASVGGSWIAPAELITRHDWVAIEARARDAVNRFSPKPSL